MYSNAKEMRQRKQWTIFLSNDSPRQSMMALVECRTVGVIPEAI